MPKFSGSEVVRHGQISLSQLGNLVETAGAAAMPYVNGFAYGSQFGSAIIQAGPESTGILSTFINTTDNIKYPQFAQQTINSITVDGSLGLLFSQDGTGNSTLAIQPASAKIPGVITTGVQQIAGSKEFLNRVMIDDNLYCQTQMVFGSSLLPASFATSSDANITLNRNANNQPKSLTVSFNISPPNLLPYSSYLQLGNAINGIYDIRDSMLLSPGYLYLVGWQGCSIGLLPTGPSNPITGANAAISFSSPSNCLITATTLQVNNGTGAQSTFTGTVPAGKSLTVVNGFITGYQ
jgi:hypothetical protein